MNRASSKNQSTTGTVAFKAASWSWLNALAADLPIAAGIVSESGQLTLLTASTTSTINERLARIGLTPAFQALAREAVAQSEPRLLTIERAEVLASPGPASQTIVVAMDQGVPAGLERWLEGLASAVRAQLTQPAEDDLEAFDRVSSLHRLLHEAVDRGSERDVVTAFAEAVFAWDGVEVSGYVQDVDGRWMLSAWAPGAQRGHERVAALSTRGDVGVVSPLSEEEAIHFGFDRTRNLLGATIAATATSDDPWLLIFAEGFGPLRESSARLYIDLLREAVGRTAAIAETRLSWLVLQQLLGAADAETAAAAALRELAQALPAAGASLVATASTGAVVLSVGDDDAHGSVRPFGRVNRLVSTLKLVDGYALDLAVRRESGDVFTRREQQALDRMGDVFGAWLTRSLRQGTVQKERRAERREFDQILDRAASQAVRDGSDVSVMVISVPEATRSTLLRSWVVELRSRMRGSDLAGALSDREIGLLLCGTTPDTVDYVCNRLIKHLKFGERGNPVGAIGIASRAAGQMTDASLVQLARRNVVRRQAAEGGGSR